MVQSSATGAESGRAALLALAFGAVAGGALVFAFGERRRAEDAEARAETAARGLLEQRIAALEAQQRTLASLSQMPRDFSGGGADRGAGRPASASGTDSDGAPPIYESRGTDPLAGRPVDADSAASRQRTGVEDSSMARAIERANRLSEAIAPGDRAPNPEPSLPASTGETPDVASRAVDTGAAGTGPTDPAPDESKLLTAFNELLASAGLERWRLLAAKPNPADRALVDVVLAERGVRGVATGSLVAGKLTLERDPITGLAAFVADSAHGIEAGVEVHYEGARCRIEIPGVLPVELVAPELRRLFGLGGEAGALVAAPTTDGAVAVTLANRALALETDLALRLRTVEKLDGDRLIKAVIDLEFDDAGKPTKTVHADAAWFEVDPDARHGELFCEGGDMTERGQRRPLYGGKLTLPLRDLAPEHWKGVPAVRRIVRG
jgi:hypothetical protein